MKTAIVLGATGLIGAEVLKLLLKNPAYGKVVAIGRRPLELKHAKLESRVVDFERLDAHADAFAGDDLFYCVGSTMKKAGSREAFRHVDFDYPVEIARLASRQGLKQWLMVTSVGASTTSSSFYLRTKGESEAAIEKLPFNTTQFFRPSMLLGRRQDFRPLEVVVHPIAALASPLMVGPLRKFRPIQATEVARQMVDAAKANG